MTEARSAAFAAHEAARTAAEANLFEAVAAARAAGHAAATAHVPTHASHVAKYAMKAVVDPVRERDWQLEHLPENLKPRLLLDK